LADQARDQDVLHAVEALLSQRAAYAGYRRWQREESRRRASDARRAGPVEFDESGFPLPQERPGFAKRVARLLSV
jgi:hypothetical protein